VNRPERNEAWSGWLVGLIALAGGLAAPVSAPVAGPLAPVHAVSVRAGRVGELVAASLAQPGADPQLQAFYAARGESPLWIEHHRVRPEARQLIAIVEGAAADGLEPASYDPQGLRAAVREAASGRPYDLARAELALSEALASWGVDLHHPKAAAAALSYTDPHFRPPDASRRAVLEQVADAPSLQAGLQAVARMNPIYVQLRAALAADAASGGAQAPLLRANLERTRGLPPDLGRRYILVDVAAQRLWAYEDGRPVDSMKVVVGKPSEPTPQLAAMVRYAVFRPYWNVPPDLVADGIAPKVLKQGLSYFQAKHLQALSDWTDHAVPLDPAAVNWKAVAAGKQELRVRQLPGPDNMMGRVKFMFPNEFGVYLHDSPLRALFDGEVRLGSAGCVRLEDAPRLGRWLLGDAAVAGGEEPGPPETRVELNEPTPVYILYLTAAPTGEGLSVRKDFYRRDATITAQLARPAGTTELASRSTGG
jgi:murein L,D-transpeptidase YcbB/YkuD